MAIEVLNRFEEALIEASRLGELVAKLESETQEREAAALGGVLARVHPVMRYLDYPVKILGHHAGQRWHSWTYDYHSERGIVLIDDTRRVPDSDDTRGTTEGEALAYSRSGKLLLLDHSGYWSRWEGEVSHWEADVKEISPSEAVRRFAFEDIVTGLVKCFRETIEKSQKKEKILRSRLEALEAIEALLK